MIKFLNFAGFLHVKICEQGQRQADKTCPTDSIKYWIITQTHFIYTLQITHTYRDAQLLKLTLNFAKLK